MFIPGTTKASDLDLAMRISLADSLSYLHSLASKSAGLGLKLDDAIDAIRSHRVAPGLFGRYYKLVLAVQQNDHLAIRRLFGEIAAMAVEPASLKVGLYSDADLGAERGIYADLIDAEPGPYPWLRTAIDDDGFAQRAVEALGILDVACPPLAEEIRGLVVQIVGALPSGKPGVRGFGSVSSFMLWGLMVANMERYKTAAELVPCIVHEAAHLFLFAHSIEGPLVLNDISERYSSPLRQDPRPMDGVYHATFVAARMYYAAKKQRDVTGSDFSPVPAEELEAQMESIRRLYFGGLETVLVHGKLSTTGRAILEETQDYMRAN